eukprot:gnl/TRDRNA2_/TRDRNA2_141434_c0_seq1.p1 gnl/TRDRNA2_/TRDRNA2_141434_c0~~gnl/TRDRNA2_/TRDRNA2_141434_c0_seq1.p1  ORF type:complete len:109 (-),score=0.63 gnl/TRDRNA2_/TRDRNA2_141434_c0_seq1:79-405(-)
MLAPTTCSGTTFALFPGYLPQSLSGQTGTDKDRQARSPADEQTSRGTDRLPTTALDSPQLSLPLCLTEMLENCACISEPGASLVQAHTSPDRQIDRQVPDLYAYKISI